MDKFSENPWNRRLPSKMAPNTNRRFDPPKNVQKKRRIVRFSHYCKDLFKQSLITGFPVIASTRNLLRKIIKIVVFLGCLGGFLYQTSEFLQLYWAYPTMVDIQVETPAEVDIPALSFCNTNRIRRKVLCRDAPKECSFLKNKTEFCLSYPKYCIGWENPANVVLGIPLFNDTYQKQNLTREYVQKYGEDLDDFMKGCVVKAHTKHRCKNKVQVSWVDSKGLPNNCFTVESIWGLPQEQIQKIPLNGKISLNLKPQPEQYLLYHDLVLVHILLHEAHSLGNPFKEGITMEAGKTYNIFINQRVTERLPAPYQTNCTDYLKLWEKNDGFGPLTRKRVTDFKMKLLNSHEYESTTLITASTAKSCTEQCKMENMLETDGCVAQSISYPGNYTICNDEDLYPSEDLIKKCSLQCKEACREVSFSLHQELAYDLTAKCNNDVNCFYKDIYLHFIFNRLEVEKFLHQPRYENVEMFSYIGGYMGMWLGISLVALFDFAETMMSLGTYICRDKRKKKAIHSYY